MCICAGRGLNHQLWGSMLLGREWACGGTKKAKGSHDLVRRDMTTAALCFAAASGDVAEAGAAFAVKRRGSLTPIVCLLKESGSRVRFQLCSLQPGLGVALFFLNRGSALGAQGKSTGRAQGNHCARPRSRGEVLANWSRTPSVNQGSGRCE